jgi:hypothetical protein
MCLMVYVTINTLMLSYLTSLIAFLGVNRTSLSVLIVPFGVTALLTSKASFRTYIVPKYRYSAFKIRNVLPFLLVLEKSLRSVLAR